MKRALYLLLSAALLVCLLPVLSTLAAGVTATLAGCDLDEGSIHPCLIAGHDWGGALYTAAMMGWFGLVTLPFAALAAALISVLALSDLIRYLWRRQRRR